MTLDDIPLFATLKSRLGYLADRQQVIAQNVANTDTPGFTPERPEAVHAAGAPGAARQPAADHAHAHLADAPGRAATAAR